MRTLIAAAITLSGLFATAAQADQTAIHFNLAAQKCKVLDPLPVLDMPVHVMGVNGFRSLTSYHGVADVTITSLRLPAEYGYSALMWVGMDYYTAKMTTGYSSTAGTHIIWLGSTVDLQVDTGTRMKLCNSSDNQQIGNITMMW